MTLIAEDFFRTWFTQVWGEKKVEAIDQYASPEWVGQGVDLPGTPKMPWRERFKLVHRQFCAAFPDITITVNHTVTQGELTAAYCTIRGTHTGEGLGFPPTGRTIEVPGIAMARIKDDQIVESWESWNLLGMYQHLGLRLT